jgi:hypothetical protein
MFGRSWFGALLDCVEPALAGAASAAALQSEMRSMQQRHRDPPALQAFDSRFTVFLMALIGEEHIDQAKIRTLTRKQRSITCAGKEVRVCRTHNHVLSVQRPPGYKQ